MWLEPCTGKTLLGMGSFTGHGQELGCFIDQFLRFVLSVLVRDPRVPPALSFSFLFFFSLEFLS